MASRTYVVKNEYPKIAVELKAKAKVSETTGADVYARHARAAAPMLTGALRASIHVDGSEVLATADYAGYQEFGTSKMPAHPYFFEGARQAQMAQMAILRTVFR
jgi:HK97 gp10 family phage protein